MDAVLYTEILEKTLLPFIQNVFPEGHKLMADKNPKHTSRHAQSFIEENNIIWTRTPAKSPDLIRLIENLWHELTKFIHREMNDAGTYQWNPTVLANCRC